MLTEAQKVTLEQSVRDVLQDFDQSGAAFTAPMLVSALRETDIAEDEDLLDQEDTEAFITDIVTRRRDELDGGPRQLVVLEIDPEQKWGFKDA
ncbi:hypothetical protein CN172_17460 [Sinorhizobium meliloti]|jgi:hypothetical protein|uniref:hypothetical protein n=1 Tax=Rhizobium meliloti TaxID=382 RepID=UPI0002D99F73|nr:hypothetical protein [Sinorhizobium meliloti]MCO5963827.1 hypothetical protein [Sinorhizobium meliloti]MDE3876170.1 hypothetical protein [Sinorhizobium meliloti]MDX0316604.1 hypothetical protein [Sinorhizobium meliloti]MDX0323166.1 hypothetical protein [Sinorhizobium meliloti]MQX42919.1 hypothetical protein [Sinorhizobium meliloti]